MPVARIIVEPFVRQPEGDEVIIGLPSRGTFIALPSDAVAILDELAAGRPVEEVAAQYKRTHGVEPDIEGLLTELERSGFVKRVRTGEPADAAADLPAPAPPLRAHFSWIPPSWARRIWSPPVLIACWIAILGALALLVFDPDLRPTARSAFFEKRTIAYLGLLMLFGLFTTFVHELAHLTAAQARGVSCRFGIGNRMWFVVWETDMTGIWAIPKRERYLPILAGPFSDLTGGALLIFLQAAAKHGLVDFSPQALQAVKAFLFIYAMRIAWQLYLFLRTDFYYAFANLFGCRNLMADARAYLAFQVRRITGRASPLPSPLPDGPEALPVRIYSWLWLAGRILAFGILFLVQLPLFFLYFARFGQMLAGRGTGSSDAVEVLSGLLFILFLTWGFGLWIREIWRSRRKETAA